MGSEMCIRDSMDPIMNYSAELAEAGTLAFAAITSISDHSLQIISLTALSCGVTAFAASPTLQSLFSLLAKISVRIAVTAVEYWTKSLLTWITSGPLAIAQALAAVWALVPRVALVYTWTDVWRIVFLFLAFFRWSEGGTFGRTLSGVLYLVFFKVSPLTP